MGQWVEELQLGVTGQRSSVWKGCEVHEIRFPVRRDVSTTTKKRLNKSETCPDVLKQM